MILGLASLSLKGFFFAPLAPDTFLPSPPCRLTLGDMGGFPHNTPPTPLPSRRRRRPRPGEACVVAAAGPPAHGCDVVAPTWPQPYCRDLELRSPFDSDLCPRGAAPSPPLPQVELGSRPPLGDNYGAVVVPGGGRRLLQHGGRDLGYARVPLQ